MLFSTPTQFAVLAILFVAGWFFGLASHPGGRKWKARYLAERDAHAALRKDSDARVAAAEKRSAELEREHARAIAAAPIAPAPVVTRATAARPAYPVGTKRGWFDFGDRGTVTRP